MSLIDTIMTRIAAPAPRRAYAFILAVFIVFLAQAAFLVSMIWDRAALLQSETEVTLAIEPVDPRDLFRGDHVILRYEISQLEEGKLPGDDGFEEGQDIHVCLEEQGAVWKPVSLHRAQPEGDGACILGLVDRIVAGRLLHITYGIESYFVPEGTGLALEHQRNEGRLTIRVALGENGEPAIKALLLDGEAIHEEPLF